MTTEDIYAYQAAVLEAERAGISRRELEQAPARVRDRQHIARLERELDGLRAINHNQALQIEALVEQLTASAAPAPAGRRLWVVAQEGA